MRRYNGGANSTNHTGDIMANFHNKSITGRVYKALSETGQYHTSKTLGRKIVGVKRTTLSVALKSLESRGLIIASPFVEYSGKRGKPAKAYKAVVKETE